MKINKEQIWKKINLQIKVNKVNNYFNNKIIKKIKFYKEQKIINKKVILKNPQNLSNLFLKLIF